MSTVGRQSSTEHTNAMPTPGSLPQESDAQRIGYLAQRCFSANHPETWRAKPLDGTDDFGFDYQVQTVIDGFVRDVFRVQLKGTTTPSQSADGTFFSVQLKASTVRYYERATEPILLVLCDLSANPSLAVSCPLYYCWIEDELRRFNNTGIPPDREYVTLRVTSSNVLTRDTDVSGHVAHHRAVFRAGRTLDAFVEEQRPTLPADARAELIERIPAGFQSRSYALVQAMAEIPATPWPEAPRGSYPWHLREASQHLRAGDEQLAQASLDSATATAGASSDLELAEHWNLRGRVHALLGDNVAARDAYAEAARIAPSVPRYVACWAEAELRLRHEAEPTNSYDDVLPALSGSDAETQGIRARLLAAAGDKNGALVIAKSIDGYEGLSAQAIIHTMASESQEAIYCCDAGLAEVNVPEKTRQLFLILRARGRFRLALKSWFSSHGDDLLPLSGPASADIEQVHAAWPDVEAAALSLRKSGWPPNVEFLADVWSSTASIIGKQGQTLPLLAEAASTRPTLTALQSALESLAIQCNDLETALKANGRQVDSNAKTLRRVALLHMDKQDAACVELMKSAEKSVPKSDPMYGAVVGMAVLSADRIVRRDIADSWAAMLSGEPTLTAHAAVLEYFRSVSRSPLGKDDALRTLKEKFESLGRPSTIAPNLFHELDPSRKEHAEECMRIADALQSERLLPLESALHLAHAFATLERWSELKQLARDCDRRFGRHTRLLALKALALDKLGFTADALNDLEALLGEARVDPLAVNTYVNIAIRCGLTQNAITSIESILSRETNRAKQLEGLRLLFGLLHQSNPSDPRCVDVAWRIGEQSNPDKEEEEGLFLVTMFAATMQAQIDPADPRIPPFQERLQAFTQRFPESKILKSVTFPEDASGDELLALLRQVSGTTEEQARWRQKVETQLERGDLPVPYAWRPRNFLGSIPDVPTLWELSKRSHSGQKQLHLTMATVEWEPAPLLSLRGRVPLLDLTALLVIADVELLDDIFKVFPTIAIGQQTLLDINELISPMTGGFIRERCAGLQTALKRHLPRIVQPQAALQTHEMRPRLRASEEIKKLAEIEGYLVYSDDALFRIYCNTSGTRSPICTLDLLCALDEGGYMQPQQVASKIARLCSWHVGLSVLARYQIASLPDALGMASSVREGVELLRRSPDSSAIFNGIWGSSKPYKDLQAQAGALLRELVERHDNSIVSVAALMALWHEKARLRTDAPMPPSRVIALLMTQAAFIKEPMSQETARRLWSVFRQLVENEHGDRMDERKEVEAISLTGEIAAHIDAEHSLQGDRSLQSRLDGGLTRGTQEEGYFSGAYSRARIAIAAKAAKDS